jgi:predicted anti-sigma-YlaC factor YlaD
MKMRCQKARKSMSLAMDNRLAPASRQELRNHLQACPACRKWQLEQSRLQEAVRDLPVLEPSPFFRTGLRARIAAAAARPPRFALSPVFSRPAILRAAMFLAFLSSALLGFFLGNRLESPVRDADAAAFKQAMNLDAFADQPVDSFGAVYERLLQGELQ